MCACSFEEVQNTTAMVYVFQGRLSDALKLHQLVRKSGQRRGDVQSQAWGLLGALRCHLHQGELVQANWCWEQRQALLLLSAGTVTSSSEISARSPDHPPALPMPRARCHPLRSLGV